MEVILSDQTEKKHSVMLVYFLNNQSDFNQSIREKQI